HPDHSGGLPYLLAHFRPREFWWTGVPGDGVEWERLEAALAASGTRVRLLAAGASLPALAGATEVLHPPADGGYASLNDSSLTLRVHQGATAVLLTGDIEARAEERLLLAPARLPAAVLKVPHHGSRTSSTPRFVDPVAHAELLEDVGQVRLQVDAGERPDEAVVQVARDAPALLATAYSSAFSCSRTFSKPAAACPTSRRRNSSSSRVNLRCASRITIAWPRSSRWIRTGAMMRACAVRGSGSARGGTIALRRTAPFSTS